MRIEISIDCPCGQEIEDDLEVPDDATDDQIAEEAKQAACDRMGEWRHSWRKEGEEEYRE